MASKPGERLAVHVRGEVRADRLAVFFAHVFRTPLRIQARHLVQQDFDLLRLEQRRKKEVTLAVAALQLFRAQLHDDSDVRFAGMTWLDVILARSRNDGIHASAPGAAAYCIQRLLTELRDLGAILL